MRQPPLLPSSDACPDPFISPSSQAEPTGERASVAPPSTTESNGTCVQSPITHSFLMQPGAGESNGMPFQSPTIHSFLLQPGAGWTNGSFLCFDPGCNVDHVSVGRPAAHSVSSQPTNKPSGQASSPSLRSPSSPTPTDQSDDAASSDSDGASSECAPNRLPLHLMSGQSSASNRLPSVDTSNRPLSQFARVVSPSTTSNVPPAATPAGELTVPPSSVSPTYTTLTLR